MTKTMKYVAHLDANAPFGYKHDLNGADFSKSHKNPDSNLARVVNYLRFDCVTPVSRSNILSNVFNLPKSMHAGWGTQIFSGMVKAGMIEKYGRGNAVRYGEGRNVIHVTKVRSQVKGRIISDAR